jgi:geranylgeranyl pyrophosphate synthase
MEKENWIESILNSTNGMTAVIPSDVLFSKIQQRMRQQDKVSPKTLWLVAASIAFLVMLNFSALVFKSKEKISSTTTYLEMTVNKSNQLYQ